MPMIATRGLASSRGFGQFVKPMSAVVAGTFGVYRSPAQATQLKKYTYANDTVSIYPATMTGDSSLTTVSQNRYALANGTKGIFGWMNAGNLTTALTKLTWASAATSSQSGINTGNAAATGASNMTLGLIVTDATGGTTNIWTFAAESSVLGHNLTATWALGTACGNSTQAIVSMGNSTTATNKYTYASNTVASATALTAAINKGAAAGNDTLGVFIGYVASGSAFSVYTWSGDTVGASTSLSPQSNYDGSFGNATTGYFISTADPASGKYNYASGTSAGATSSGTSPGVSWGAYGTGNGTPGVSA